ncbi:hypothetical protein V1520DRAFT_54416 [Lipomyces starkeyi]
MNMNFVLFAFGQVASVIGLVSLTLSRCQLLIGKEIPAYCFGCVYFVIGQWVKITVVNDLISIICFYLSYCCNHQSMSLFAVRCAVMVVLVYLLL